MLGAKLCLCPGDCGLRIGIQAFNAAADCGGIMIAEHDYRTIRCVLFDQVEHGHRVRSVANQVAKKRIPFGPQRPGVGKALANRLQVAMNVGKQGPLLRHRDRSREGRAPTGIAFCGKRH